MLAALFLVVLVLVFAISGGSASATQSPNKSSPYLTAVEEGSTIMIPLHDGADCTTQLTSVADGINWDYFGSDAEHGTHTRVAWLKQGAECGWLAIRDDKGHIYNVHRLVGNLMWQPLPEYPKDYRGNGFYALWEYDQPDLYGDKDGKITSGDGIWGKTGLDGQPDLGVWQDTCHCGILEYGKWHSLRELGVTAIDLKFEKSDETDNYGNKFRFKGYAEQNGKKIVI